MAKQQVCPSDGPRCLAQNSIRLASVRVCGRKEHSYLCQHCLERAQVQKLASGRWITVLSASARNRKAPSRAARQLSQLGGWHQLRRWYLAVVSAPVVVTVAAAQGIGSDDGVGSSEGARRLRKWLRWHKGRCWITSSQDRCCFGLTLLYSVTIFFTRGACKFSSGSHVSCPTHCCPAHRTR
jgi:hypothetical protein